MKLIKHCRKVVKRLRRYIEVLRRQFISPDYFTKFPNALAGSNSNYTKFIVLGHQRSGSSLVIKSLRYHPEVVAFGELFGKRNRINFNVEGYDHDSEEILFARDKYPIDFLDRYIFSSYEEERRAVGFKVFPHQLDGERFCSVWDWIENTPDLAVVFLSRRNKLATYVSLLIAEKTGVFGVTEKSQRPAISITIDPEKCEDEFRKHDRYEEIARKRLQGKRVLEIDYEDLSESPKSVIVSVQNFLGLDVLDPEIPFVKKEVRPLSVAVDNYQELKERFATTKWSRYFDA